MNEFQIVMSEYVNGPGTESHNLLEHLRKESVRVINVRHPSLALAPNSFPTIIEIADNGISKATIWIPLPPIFRRLLSFIRDFVVTMYEIASKKMPNVATIYVGRESFCTLPGLILKKLGLVQFVIMFNADYPLAVARYSNQSMYRPLRFLESYCISRCDSVWDSTDLMQALRKTDGISVTPKKQLVVPSGNNFYRVSRLSDTEINRFSVAYAGILSEGKGIQLLISCLPRLVARFPQFHLHLIGDGPFRAEIESELEKSRLKGAVTFYGYVPLMSEIESILTKCGVGIALYDSSPANYARYTDPAKPKLYLSCGLPVIITRVPSFAHEIETCSAGKVIHYSSDELETALITLLNDSETYSFYRKRAIELGSKYDWSDLVHNALAESLSSFHAK